MLTVLLSSRAGVRPALLLRVSGGVGVGGEYRSQD